MRLDKFLKVSRLIKRRTLAREVADSGRITVNGRVAKPSTAIVVGDEIVINFAKKSLKARVLRVQESASKADSSGMVEIIEEIVQQPENDFWNK